jgi:hypothetical protein
MSIRDFLRTYDLRIDFTHTPLQEAQVSLKSFANGQMENTMSTATTRRRAGST